MLNDENDNDETPTMRTSPKVMKTLTKTQHFEASKFEIQTAEFENAETLIKRCFNYENDNDETHMMRTSPKVMRNLTKTKQLKLRNS